jgi:hypothetical protein
MTRLDVRLELPPTPALHFEAYRRLLRAGARGLADASGALADWEESTHLHLPLRALREAAELDAVTIGLLLGVGLADEDGGTTDEGAPPGRPTLGALVEQWRAVAEEPDLRAAVRRLTDLGLLRITNAEAPRADRVLEVPDPIWDLLRGETPERPAPWARHRPAEDLLDASDLVPVEGVAPPAVVAERLAKDGVELLVLRGPERCSRRTWLGALARELGRGLLEVTPARPDDGRWSLVAPMATLLDALPVVVATPVPGETIEIPRLPGCRPPLAALLGREGAVRTPGLERSATIWFSLPSPEVRRRHWEEALGSAADPDLDGIARRFRMTAGNIRRAAALASAQAVVESEPLSAAHIGRAVALLHRHSLDDVATPVTVSGGWSELAVAGDIMRELVSLEMRCRHRERLRDEMGGAPGGPTTCGVRALFSGPSGTGKSLATRLLAARLGIDLYRIELTVVSKFIGETERNLDRIFRVAEEQDVILVLDEGDALLAPRTGVSTSVDRYANLETNFLLQRLESFDGILLVTSNAADRIDPAFERRLDVTIAFRAPEACERRAIWDLHLPAGHQVPSALLDELADRCAFSGGQIRNAAIHASLMALADGARLTAGHLEDAVRREYRKAGASCPLRRPSGAVLRPV